MPVRRKSGPEHSKMSIPKLNHAPRSGRQAHLSCDPPGPNATLSQNFYCDVGPWRYRPDRTKLSQRASREGLNGTVTARNYPVICNNACRSVAGCKSDNVCGGANPAGWATRNAGRHSAPQDFTPAAEPRWFCGRARRRRDWKARWRFVEDEAERPTSNSTSGKCG